MNHFTQEPAAADHHPPVPARWQVSAAPGQVQVVDPNCYEGQPLIQCCQSTQCIVMQCCLSVDESVSPGVGSDKRRQQLLLTHHHRLHGVLQHRPRPHGPHEGKSKDYCQNPKFNQWPSKTFPTDVVSLKKAAWCLSDILSPLLTIVSHKIRQTDKIHRQPTREG